MHARDVARPLPGARRLSLIRQRLAFSGSSQYWERRYSQHGSSGSGSYGEFGLAKAQFLTISSKTMTSGR